ncbi:MAG TPA: DNA helicase RecQ [Phycisphaerae bacterium]|nr:DNA helicase RecQ [Phycisphaerae bacterium]
MNALRRAVRQHWGYTTFRPLQLEAMAAAVEGRDLLAVMPTGGGKSLCYQAPPLVSSRLSVVVSPLIALMKDQVDRLITRGIPAAFFNSSLDAADKRRVIAGLQHNEYKLLFVAPERFQNRPFLYLLQQIGVGGFAIDEAHCISHWGHDFRLDYRQLGRLKQHFPRTPVHAFTATATPRVREDIVAQLGQKDPLVLVGDFFRPNLSYQVVRRDDMFDNVLARIRKRPGHAGIVYCIRRADVDALAAHLQSAGIRAAGYHAGMSDAERTTTQDAFAAGETDVVVATVAFGMGIDRADIRFVIHAAMPKTIEHYQQETGRAGRDGQPADCILLYSEADYQLWKSITEKEDSPNKDDQLRLLSEMYAYCTGVRCRHARLVSYFGQPWGQPSCGACDVCNGTADAVPDAMITAQKVLSCVVRTRERYGAAYIAEVLRGEPTDRVIQRGHQELSTFGLMPDQRKPVLMAWIDQLVDQQMLVREGEYRVLKVTARGWQVLRGQEEVRLLEVGARGRARRARRARKPGPASRSTATGMDTPAGKAVPEPLDVHARQLFERLKTLRLEIAGEHNVPAFMICSDRTLRDIVRHRPTSEQEMLAIHGIGPAKYESFGRQFIQVIRDHFSGSR